MPFSRLTLADLVLKISARMLVLRLSRVGRKKYAAYRVVAADSRRAAQGKFVSLLGHYNPHTKELVLKKEEIAGFLKNGARPSNSLIRLLEKEKIQLPDWAKYHSRQKPSKSKKTAAEEKAATAKPSDEAQSTEEQPAETPAVAEEAQKQAEATAESVPDKNVTETAASEQSQADKAKQGEKAAAEAAVEAAEPAEKSE